MIVISGSFVYICRVFGLAILFCKWQVPILWLMAWWAMSGQLFAARGRQSKENT